MTRARPGHHEPSGQPHCSCSCCVLSDVSTDSKPDVAVKYGVSRSVNFPSKTLASFSMYFAFFPTVFYFRGSRPLLDAPAFLGNTHSQYGASDHSRLAGWVPYITTVLSHGLKNPRVRNLSNLHLFSPGKAIFRKGTGPPAQPKTAPQKPKTQERHALATCLQVHQKGIVQQIAPRRRAGAAYTQGRRQLISVLEPCRQRLPGKTLTPSL